MNLKNAIQQATKKVAVAMIEGETREWPPTCIALAYQPIRPQRNRNELPNSNVVVSEAEGK